MTVDYETFLFVSINNNNLSDALDAVTNLRSLNFYDSLNQTPMYHAVIKGNPYMVRLLLLHGANPNERHLKTGLTLLHVACQSKNRDVVMELISNGANVNDKDPINMTPLHYACKQGNLEIVQLLLNCNAEVNAEDKDHKTPLICAVISNDLATVEYVVKKNAKLDAAAGLEQYTALHIAVKNLNIKMVGLLLSWKANPNSRDAEGRSPLHHAAQLPCVDILDILIDFGADINAQTKNECRTPLHTAVRYHQPLIVERLAESDADLNAQDFKQRTPLHFLCVSKNKLIAHSLINRGADLTATTWKNMSPLGFCVNFGKCDEEMLKTIVKYVILRYRQNKSVCQSDLVYIDRKMMSLKTDCEKELVQMRREQLHPRCNLTLFDFITTDLITAIETLWEEPVRSDLLKKNFAETYPMYEDLIVYRINLANRKWTSIISMSDDTPSEINEINGSNGSG